MDGSRVVGRQYMDFEYFLNELFLTFQVSPA